MKKIYYILSGLLLALIVALGYKTPAKAASYRAQLILESYEVEEGAQIGESTTVKAVFKNVDASYNIRNILISYTSNGNTVIPVEGKSNQFYFETIRPNDTLTVDIPVVIARTEGGYASMIFSIEYISDDSRWSSNCYIVFPVQEEEKTAIVLKNVSVPGEVSEGGNVLISTTFLNTSDFDMFNTEFIITGDINEGSKVSSLGTVAPRRNAYGEAYVSFYGEGSKDITLSIKYEDSEGEIHEEILGQYSVTVKDESIKVNTSVPGTGNNGNSGNGSVGPAFSIATLLLIASGVIVVIIVVVVIINVTRKRK